MINHCIFKETTVQVRYWNSHETNQVQSAKFLIWCHKSERRNERGKQSLIAAQSW